MNKVIYFFVVFLSLAIIPVFAATPLNQGGSVYILDSGEWSGLEYHIYRTESGWLLEFYSDETDRLGTYYELARLGAKGKLDAVVTLDFRPGLNCDGEYDVLLQKQHFPLKTRYGFSLPLKGTSDWDSLDYSRLMIYFDSSEVNVDRCKNWNRKFGNTLNKHSNPTKLLARSHFCGFCGR